jgi:uncharacterized protein (DUF849 family)
MGLAGPGVLQTADLAVAQAVVTEGEDLPSDGDAGDFAPAAFGDPLELLTQRAAAGGNVRSGLHDGPAQDRGSLPGDVP